MGKKQPTHQIIKWRLNVSKEKQTTNDRAQHKHRTEANKQTTQKSARIHI